MSITLEMLVGNTAYDLSDYETYIHHSNNGWGLPGIDLYSQSGPLQDGATYNDFRLQPRDLSLVIGLNGVDSSDYFAKRKQLFNIFKPKRDNTLKLRLTLDDGSVRQLDTTYVEGLGADGSEKQAYYHRFAIGLRAYDPTWYDPVLANIPFGIVSSSGFSVPMAVPLAVGVSTINQTVSVDYTGTWDSYPIFTVVGPVTDLSITNVTTGDNITISGAIAGGDTYTIDTRYGYKTIVDQNGVNKIAQYSGDLATFRLVAPEDDSDSRVNDITVTGTGATSVTRIYLQYHTRYIGI